MALGSADGSIPQTLYRSKRRKRSHPFLPVRAVRFCRFKASWGEVIRKRQPEAGDATPDARRAAALRVNRRPPARAGYFRLSMRASLSRTYSARGAPSAAAIDCLAAAIAPALSPDFARILALACSM